MAAIGELLAATPLELRFQLRAVAGTNLLHQVVDVLGEEGQETGETYRGKGLTEEQSLISCMLELVERRSARLYGDETLVRASYRDVRRRACNPRRFVLAEDSSYSPAVPVEWIWGHSLTRDEAVLVPAGMVFLPYFAATPAQQVLAVTDSNGLASGNCLEEAILHALLEVVERDARLIMEYNRLIMPDVPLEADGTGPFAEVLRELQAGHLQWWVKDITNDLGIPSFSVFLRGTYEGEESVSCSSGTHLDPEVALARALTEAIQLYPRCAHYEDWIAGPMDHHYLPAAPSAPRQPWQSLPCDDLREALEACVQALAQVGAEVIAVDLTRPELGFATARVCVSALQPILMPSSRRISERLLTVPVTMGYRAHPLRSDEIVPRHLCGFSMR